MAEDEVADLYAAEAYASMSAEAESRLAEVLDPVEEARLSSLSLVDLVFTSKNKLSINKINST